MRENWKDFHRKRGLPVNRSRTRGHNVCHAAIKPSMQNKTPSVKTKKKKKKGEDQIYIYIYVCVCVCVYLYVCKYLIIPNQVCASVRKWTNLLIFLRPSKVWTTPGIRGSWWAQVSRLCRPQSWSGTNNTSRLIIPVMVTSPGRARSPLSILGPLQNIYSLPCRWKDDSPLAHHRSVTKREWISPSMSQRIEKGVCTYTDIYIYIYI